jgi:CHRD domain
MRGMSRVLLAALLAASGCVAGRPATLCAHLEGAGDSSTDALDPVHQGNAVLSLEKTAIRFSIIAPGLQTVTAAHIHHGASGTYGPMLWEINSGYKGDSIRGTASEIPPGVIALIAREPAEYYVKLHTPAFPGGAIRGQLGPCSAHARLE